MKCNIYIKNEPMNPQNINKCCKWCANVYETINIKQE